MIFGTGYVGTANAIGFAWLGHDVTGYDIAPERVAKLSNGITPYHEDGIVDGLRSQLAAGRLRFTAHLAEAMSKGVDVIILAVPTPSDDTGAADLSALNAASAALATFDLTGTVVVLRSTVPPGTTRELQRRLPEASVVFSPEFLREGFALEDFVHPSRTVIGADDFRAARTYADLLASLERPMFFTSPTDAETIKAFSNAFLGVKISFANEVANFCDAIGANAPVVLGAIAADPRIGPSCLAPGIGFGGPCLTKDIRALRASAEHAGFDTELLSATLRINDAQPHRVVTILEEELGCLDGTTIAVWGLAFKAGTDDVRHSLALQIIDEIIARGARIRAYDPVVTTSLPAACEMASSAIDALNADALLLLTDWPEFAAIDPHEVASRLRRRLVVDGRNALSHRVYAAAGLRYRGIGLRALPAPLEELVGSL
jgi:UDPglucose 6-dehydrogenase